MRFWTKEASAAWFDDNWGYRTALTFTHNADVSNQKVKFDIDTATLISAGKMQADCGDSRFTDASGKQLKYYLDTVGGACNGATTDYYVLMPTIINGSNLLYHYYGNPSAANGTQAAQFTEATLTPSGGTPLPATEENAPSPALYFKFDEGTGTSANDTTTNANNGTLAGTTLPTWQAADSCVSEKCLYFNGITSRVTVANTVNSVKSISFWVRSSTASASLIQLTSSVDVRANAGTITTSGITSPTIYVNGEARSTGYTANQWNYVTITSSTGITANAISVGKSLLGNLNGFMDEVKLYPYVRSAVQVKADFNSRGGAEGSGGVLGSNSQKFLTDGLVGYWKMDEATGQMTVVRHQLLIARVIVSVVSLVQVRRDQIRQV